MRRGLKGPYDASSRRAHSNSSIFPDEEGTERAVVECVAGDTLAQQHLPR